MLASENLPVVVPQGLCPTATQMSRCVPPSASPPLVHGHPIPSCLLQDSVSPTVPCAFPHVTNFSLPLLKHYHQHTNTLLLSSGHMSLYYCPFSLLLLQQNSRVVYAPGTHLLSSHCH